MIRRVAIRRRLRDAHPPECHPVVARVLAGRGCSRLPDYSIGALLRPEIGGLDRASALLADCIERDARILVVGDFDADGATGTALGVRGLLGLGARNVTWRMPDRAVHGYGLGPRLARECLAEQPAIVVTVDHGVSSLEGIALLRAAGVDVIVTDHHLPGPQLPEASALVNPNLPGETFGSPNLAGVGVMFYTLIALRAELRRRGAEPGFRLDRLLDLVALGTVADLVPLDENNRRLVYQGLKRIRARQSNPGVAALLEVAGRNLSHVTAADLGFVAGPRLNAAGRLDDMSIGIRCLLAEDFEGAMQHAQTLDALNRDRRALQAEMTETAEAIVAERSADLSSSVGGFCLYDDGWHPGVVGLVASRVCERTRRPVVALAPADSAASEYKGSCRSPSGVHMRDLLADLDAANPGLIDRFGGHAGAAGLSLAGDRIDDFRDAFDRRVAELRFDAEEVLTDGALSAAEMSVDTAQALEDSGPWGQGWAEPLFDGRFRIVERRVVGRDHLKLVVEPVEAGPTLDAIAFGAGRFCHEELPEPLHVTYRLELNRWRGRVSAQLNVQHFVESIRE